MLDEIIMMEKIYSIQHRVLYSSATEKPWEVSPVSRPLRQNQTHAPQGMQHRQGESSGASEPPVLAPTSPLPLVPGAQIPLPAELLRPALRSAWCSAVEGRGERRGAERHAVRCKRVTRAVVYPTFLVAPAPQPKQNQHFPFFFFSPFLEAK